MYYDKPNVNLLSETINAIKNSEHSIKDIHHVIVKHVDNTFFNKEPKEVAITWEDFSEVAKNVDYYNGYGTEVIWTGCQVVFNDNSFLERKTYDGSEWWAYIKIPSLNITIEKYNPKTMSVKDMESEEELKRLEERKQSIERKIDNEIVMKKLELESKPFTLQDFIK